MLTRKHYRMIARAIDTNTINNKGVLLIDKVELIKDLCGGFQIDNKLFNRDKFVNACSGHPM